jgi:hypothetical protein
MEILFRLIKDGKVVAYERFDFDWHRWEYSPDLQSWSEAYFPHDRKDLYTGLEDKNGRKIFERDVWKIEWHFEYDSRIPEYVGVVVFEEAEFYVREIGDGINGCSIFDAIHNYGEVIGIEGVEE